VNCRRTIDLTARLAAMVRRARGVGQIYD